LGVEIMDSRTFLLSSKSNSKIDGNQITFGTVDFLTHPPTLDPIFASLDQEMDLMVGSLNFCVGSLGSLRLLGSIYSDPLANKTIRVTTSGISAGSSSEVNLSAAPNRQKEKGTSSTNSTKSWKISVRSCISYTIRILYENLPKILYIELVSRLY
jgi:hypothetical protein